MENNYKPPYCKCGVQFSILYFDFKDEYLEIGCRCQNCGSLYSEDWRKDE